MAFKYKEDRELVSEGVIGPNCPHHTAEEWLEILQKKSLAQGRAISWYDIKNDPDINHLEIKQLLGLYSQYESKLRPAKILETMPKTAAAEPTKVAKATKTAKTIKATSATNVLNPRLHLVKPEKPENLKKSGEPERIELDGECTDRAESSDECLGKIVVPPLSAAERGLVIISALNEDDSEICVELKQLQISDHTISNMEIERLIRGLSRIGYFSTVTVYPDRITADIVWQDSGYPGRETQISFRVLPQCKVRFWIIAVVFKDGDCESCDQLICECRGTATGQITKIINQEKREVFTKSKRRP